MRAGGPNEEKQSSCLTSLVISRVPSSTSCKSFGQRCILPWIWVTKRSQMFWSVVSINADPSLAAFNWFFWTFCDGIAVVQTGKNSRWGEYSKWGYTSWKPKGLQISKLVYRWCVQRKLWLTEKMTIRRSNRSPSIIHEIKNVIRTVSSSKSIVQTCWQTSIDFTSVQCYVHQKMFQ